MNTKFVNNRLTDMSEFSLTYYKECNRSCLYAIYINSLDQLRNKIRELLDNDPQCILVNAVAMEGKIGTIIMIQFRDDCKMKIYSIEKAPDKIDEMDIRNEMSKSFRIKPYSIGLKFH